MDLSLIPNNTPENVLNTEVTLGKITFDVDLIKKTIQSYLSKYEGLVVQESDIKNIKSEVAFLRKQKTLINKNRIEFSKKFDEPLIEYKNNCDSVMEVIEDTITYLNDQLNNFEKKRKEEKKQEVELLMEKVKLLKHMPDNFEFNFDEKFLNATYKLSVIKEDLLKQCNQYEIINQLEKEIEEKTKTKKIYLEDLISKYNEKLNYANKLRYTDYENILYEIPLEELEELIKNDFDKKLKEEKSEAIIKEKTIVDNTNLTKEKYLIKTEPIDIYTLEKIKEFIKSLNIEFEIEKITKKIKIDNEFEICA